MTDKINRRTFIKQTTAVGASAVIGGQILFDLFGNGANSAFASDIPDIVAIKGTDYYANTIKAVDMIGGMSKFVSKDAVVGLNVNAVRNTPGTNVGTGIVLAVMNMCYQAGAKKVVIFKEFPNNYWKGSNLAEEHQEQIKSLEYSGWDTKKVDLPKAKTLKEAYVISELLECDVYINMPIIKHHEGTLQTGVLKNVMGATPHQPTNRLCHEGPNYKGDFYEDIPHLTQCIADLNLIRKPNLIICDCTEFITENGPFGPGPLKKPDNLVVGIDPVATDAYCARFLGLNGPELPTVVKAAEHGLGTADLTKLNIKEIDG
ncbi:MAG: hypothetical protein CVT49_16280 [candidate division Zixibacteria bacterium HGW-Zixibacteria-1]|nr:MAG: hypothetical protein CVT49_16280 [candidate division Zixibacteria bacterium HGW-Zixibacteria-1]